MTAAQIAPVVSPRETRKPAFPSVVHTYTDALRVLRDGGPAGHAALAEATGRDRSNVRKDLHRLRDADVVQLDGDDRWAITAKGLRWLDGADVAEGLRTAGDDAALPANSLPAWPIDGFRLNPANRPVDLDTIPDLADSIEARGLLQPLLASPPDAGGVRTLWAGERRWRAIVMLRAQVRLPDDLAAGIPFVEREASEAEALAITLAENTERQNLTPLEEAEVLARLSDAWGEDGRPVDGKALAERLGRARQTRQIQIKLKVAREATPEAKDAYRRDRSWDALVATVQKAREPDVERAADDWVNGTPYERRFDPHNPKLRARGLAPDLDWDRTGPTSLLDFIDGRTLTTFQLPHPARSKAPYDGFPRAQLQIAKLQDAEGWVYRAGYSTSGFGHHEAFGDWISGDMEAFRDRETAIAAGVDLIRDSLGGMSRFKLPADVDAWLRDMLDPAKRPLPQIFSWAPVAVHASPFAAVEGWTEPMLTLTELEDSGLFAVQWRAHLSDRRVASAPPTCGRSDRDGPLRAAVSDMRRHLRDALPREALIWLDQLLNPSGNPLTVFGHDHPNEARANEARRAAGLLPRQANHGAGHAPAEPAAAAEPEAEAERLPARQQEALIELAHLAGRDRWSASLEGWKGEPEKDLTTHGAPVRDWWLASDFAELRNGGFLRLHQEPGGAPALAVLTAQGVAHLKAEGVPLPVPTSFLSVIQRQNGPVTPWLQPADKPTAQDDPPWDAAPATEDDADGRDEWGRDLDRIEADEALLQRARALSGATLFGDGRALAQTLGFAGPFTVDGDCTVWAQPPGDDDEARQGLIAIDVNRDLPADRAEAVAHLVRWALAAVFAEPAPAAEPDQ